MRLFSMIVLAVCFVNIAFAKNRTKKPKDTFSDDSTQQASSIESSSSNWIPLVLQRNGYGVDIENGYGRGIDNGYGRDIDNDYGRGMDNGYGGVLNNVNSNGYGGLNNDNGYGRGMENGNIYGRGMENGNGYGRGLDKGNGYGRGMDNGNGYAVLNNKGNGYGRGMDNGNAYGIGLDNGNNYPVMGRITDGPPIQKLQKQLYVSVGLEHPIYTGRTIASARDVTTGGTSRPSSGVITVTSNSDRYTDGSQGNQGQGSVTPLAVGSDYGSSGSANAGPVTSNIDTGYNGNPTNYPGYGSSSYTNYGSNVQNGVTADYTTTALGSGTSGTGYSQYENNQNYDIPTYYQTGPSNNEAFQTGAYGSIPGVLGGYTTAQDPSSGYYASPAPSSVYSAAPAPSGGYTPSPAPSSGYVGYGGTFHNYGQYTSFPVTYRGRLPQIVVVGAYGNPWSPNRIEQTAGYYLYR